MTFSRFAPRLLGLLAAVTLTSAQAVNFGTLNVTPRGAQNLNLETGATDMPQGGTVTDRGGGLTMTAARLQLRPNEILQAQGATVKTKYGGTLKASQVTYNLRNGTVIASGNVSYADARMQGLRAQQIVLYVKSGFIVAQGNLQASAPGFNARALVFDLNTMQGVLAGPYVMRSRLGTMTGAAGKRLLLTFAGNALTGASSRFTASDLARFRPYLKE